MGNPPHIDTSVRYASMRQIHAAIEHLHRGDFECAITLAAAGEGMLPPTDKEHFFKKARKLEKEVGVQPDGVTGANDIINWLKHGEIFDQATGKRKRYETATIEELEVIVTIYRGITKFEAIFENEKTPQMLSFKNWALPYLEDK
jgi:tRNA threonylcarbamoyladenosine modification (KEOPS) complex Cgi121 subunit